MPLTNPTPHETIRVSKKALFELLVALNGPSHQIRELQFTRGLSLLTSQAGCENPIDLLQNQYMTSESQVDVGEVLNSLQRLINTNGIGQRDTPIGLSLFPTFGEWHVTYSQGTKHAPHACVEGAVK
jgi:hypothetical protein